MASTRFSTTLELRARRTHDLTEGRRAFAQKEAKITKGLGKMWLRRDFQPRLNSWCAAITTFHRDPLATRTRIWPITPRSSAKPNRRIPFVTFASFCSNFPCFVRKPVSRENENTASHPKNLRKAKPPIPLRYLCFLLFKFSLFGPQAREPREQEYRESPEEPPQSKTADPSSLPLLPSVQILLVLSASP